MSFEHFLPPAVFEFVLGGRYKVVEIDKRQQLGIKTLYLGPIGYCKNCGQPDVVNRGVCQKCHEKKG